tara:strand:- start:163 stop:405 length:243 start_codon:yes stop_codon:yes gene_type:complete
LIISGSELTKKDNPTNIAIELENTTGPTSLQSDFLYACIADGTRPTKKTGTIVAMATTGPNKIATMGSTSNPPPQSRHIL